MENKSAFYEDRIEQAVRVIESGFKLNISLHDLRGTIRHSDGSVLLPQRHLHCHPCCLCGRYTETGWDDRCYHDCFTVSEKMAGSESVPFIKKCWKGIGELVVPIFHDRQHLLTIYAGTFRVTGASVDLPGHIGVEYRRLFRRLPRLDEDKLKSLGNMLSLFGQGIIDCVCNCERDAGDDTSRGAAIRRFINSNAHRRITLPDLAAHLHLSPSRASHAVKEYTGMTFQDLLLKERMLRARNLLLLSQGTLEEISTRLGFVNSFYFCRVFAKFYGQPPGEFRRTHLVTSTD